MTYFTAQLLSIGVVVVGFTYLDVVFGELVPKVLALRHPLWVAILSSRFLSAFETGLRPFVSFLEWSTRTFIQIFLKPRRWRPIEENKSEFEWDVLPDAHRHLVLNAVALEKRRLQDMYLPWSEVVWVDWNQSFEEVAKIVTSSEHSRFPVLKNGNLEGIITNRDFTAAVLSGQTEWHTLLRKVCRLQQTTKLLHALKSLQGRKNQIAVVYDGSRIVGITTVRDIFEKIIGDIYDEDDVSALQHLLGSSGKIPLHPPQDSRAPL
jgi:putative hemolysin